MASIRTRRRADGGKSYEIRWRLGGTADGPEQSETVRDDKIKARKLRPGRRGRRARRRDRSDA